MKPVKTKEGRACKVCGETIRYISSSACVACDRVRKRKEYAALTAEQKKEKAAYLRKWKDDNRDSYLASRQRYHRLIEYGVSAEQLEDMLVLQNRKCPGCNTTINGDRNTHVDHDHITGKVRGLLCMHCNIALGMVRESIETLLRLGMYLEQHSG